MNYMVHTIIMSSLCLLASSGYAKKTDQSQPVAGRVTLRNGTQEEIEVYFYATRAKKRKKPACVTFIRIIPPLESTTITPKNCSINVIEVHHTPEEDFERVTKEFLSLDDQQTETFFEYQGPNRILQVMLKR